MRALELIYGSKLKVVADPLQVPHRSQFENRCFTAKTISIAQLPYETEMHVVAGLMKSWFMYSH